MTREQLEAGARTAVLVRRSDLPVPFAHDARSFFGGLPKLPPELDWPSAEVEGNVVALTFVAQIDLTELPNSAVPQLLPQMGTLYFFCSSAFEGEGRPLCRVYYHAARVDHFPERKPPPDLMPLAGGESYEIKWLDPATDLHAKVEFKHPISFLPFRDFVFHKDSVGRELLGAALCEALGPGEPKGRDLLAWRTAGDYAKDEGWPFNWLLIARVARSLISCVRHDLRPSPYAKPVDDETRATLQEIEAGANRWLERGGKLSPLEGTDADAKQAFRAWWSDVAEKYRKMRGKLSTYPHQIPGDLGSAIDHTIRYMAAHDERALVDAAGSYVANLKRRNHWKTPGPGGGARFFDTAIHQMLGYGSSWQDAPDEHRNDVLLLQIHGDDAFFGWHANIGCVLHFWIGRDALSKLDFSKVEATLECD